MKKLNRLVCALLLASASWSLAIAQENSNYILHTIEKGQSLYSISCMYGVSQQDIVKLNPGSDEKVLVGHTLRIPKQDNAVQGGQFHTIAAGETLYRLTVNYGVTAKAICDANPGLSADNFRIGQVIRIPAATQTAPSQPTATPQTVEPLPEAVKSRCREMHRVKRKETVFSISRTYGISEAELIAANPELKTGSLKKGALLCIPYTTTAGSSRPATQTIPTDKELFQESRNPVTSYKVVKAAVMLPFLDVPPHEASRMVEYYEGVLMAVDSLKRTGTSIDLYTYNTGGENNSLQTLLAKPELTQMDLIIGPRYTQHIKPLADFCRKHRIRLVIPFTSKDNNVFNNPSVYQVNTPQSYLYSEVYDHFLRQFAKAHVVFIEATQGTQEKAEFIKGLKEELASHGIPTHTVSEEATAESLKEVLRHDRPNLFIPTSGSNPTLLKILPQLVVLVREHPEDTIHLFGYPEWQTYTKDHLDAFFELDTYFYSSFYTNNLLPAAIRFTDAYRKWYSKEMDDRYPKYGMLGFDTAFFFLKGLASYGTDFEKKMNGLHLTPIQTGFKFQRVNNWGGFINRKVFFVRFTKQFELIKLDYDN